MGLNRDGVDVTSEGVSPVGDNGGDKWSEGVGGEPLSPDNNASSVT